MEKTATVVLGAHRSGTSAMARALSLTGLKLPRTLMLAQADNTEGFWESQAIAELNDEVLAARDTDWCELFPLDEAPLLSNSAAVFMARAEALILSEFEEHPHIVLKDPRISLLGAFWRRVLTRVGYGSNFVLMVRHPMEVARSLAARNACSIDRGLLIWLANMLSAERSTREEKRLMVLYEDLLQHPRSTLDDIEAMLGHPLPKRTPKSELEVERWLDSALHHHRSPAEIRARGDLYAMVQDAYDWFRAAATGASPPTERLDRIGQQLKGYQQVFASVLAELKGDTETLRADLELSRRGEAAARREAERLSSALTLEQAQFKQLSTALTHERAKADVLQTDLAREQGELRRLAAELTQGRAALDGLTADMLAARAQAERLEVVLQDERRAGAQLAGELHAEREGAGRLSQALAAEEASGARLRAELERAGVTTADALAELGRERDALARLGAELVDERAATARLRAELDDERLSVTRLTEELALARATVEQVSAALSAEQAESAHRASEAASLRAALDDERRTHRSLQDRLEASAEALRRTSELERGLEEARATIQGHERRLADHRAQSEAALHEAQALLISSHKRHLEESRAQVRQAMQRTRELERALERRADDAEAARREHLAETQARRDAEQALAAETEGRSAALAELAAQGEVAENLRRQLAEVACALEYLQRRDWWRLVSWVKTILGGQPSHA